MAAVVMPILDVQGTNGSQIWDTSFAIQALLEVCDFVSLPFILQLPSCVWLGLLWALLLFTRALCLCQRASEVVTFLGRSGGEPTWRLLRQDAEGCS